MNAFLDFMTNAGGRWIRIIVGLALIGWGLFISDGLNWILIIIGMVPLAAGIFDFCIFAPLFGFPLGGRNIREKIHAG